MAQPNVLTCTFIKWLEKRRHVSSGVTEMWEGVLDGLGLQVFQGWKLGPKSDPHMQPEVEGQVRSAQLVLSSRTLYQDVQLETGSWETPNYE